MTTSTTHSQPIQVNSSLSEIICFAAHCRAAHFAFGRPMRESEGFKEANIAHDLSAAFRMAGFYIFPEFPLDNGGSMDAVFVRKDEVVICEWKRCYAGSAAEISNQTKRMVNFNPKSELVRYPIQGRMCRSRFLFLKLSHFRLKMLRSRK